jgi:beta-1,4-mannosyl-glycoprotein beta-1,4-N-acetylglucosaminyltransferase
MKIYDCFMFYDEKMILDLRLNCLDPYIDKFIIVESSFTHSGQIRKLKFNINNYPNFKKKIIYIVLENQPDNLSQISESDSFDEKNSKYILNALKRENLQRNTIEKGLADSSPEDIVIISDVDEIPNLELFDFKNIQNNIFLFKQKFYYYKFNLKLATFDWYGTKACKRKNLISPQWLRNIKDKKYPFWRIDTLFSKKKFQNIEFVANGGWHFSNMKSAEEIETKLKTYLHHREYDVKPLGKAKIEEIMKNKKSVYNLNTDAKNEKIDGTQDLVVTDTSELPKYLKMNINKYKEWLDN